jgi:hypothetical protein
MKFNRLTIIFIILLLGANVFAQSRDLFLGIKLRPEVQAIVGEIEKKTGKKIYAEFTEQTDFFLGSSYISENGLAIIQVDTKLEDTPQKLEAVIAHELLHLRLRVNNYPVFLFSPTIKTAKGLAQDVEQPNVNDLTSMIEHRIFKSELEKFGLYKLIDLAGDTAREAKRNKGKENSEADSINYARAILEYQNPKDIEAVRKAYEENGWTRSLREGKQIADIISQSNLQAPKDAETAFLKCVLILYVPPKSSFTLKLTPDTQVKAYRQMIINTQRKSK